jgi:hypothetical protein
MLLTIGGCLASAAMAVAILRNRSHNLAEIS